MLTFHIARRFIWRSRLQSALIISGIAVGIGSLSGSRPSCHTEGS